MPFSQYYNVNYTQPGEALVLEGTDWDGLTFRKELIYEDDFHKKTENVDQRFTVDTLKLDHWCNYGNMMLQNGVAVPVPIKHTTDPEARRGSIIRFERGLNNQGKEALFGVIRFRDKKAAQLAKSSDVSIFVPKEVVTDGKGREYPYVVRHVCLTDYPVIPGLSGFEAIAASLDAKPMGLIKAPNTGLTKVAKVGRLAKVGSFAKHLGAGIAVGHVGAKIGEKVGGHKGKVAGEIGGHLLGGHLAHKVNPKHLKFAVKAVGAFAKRHPAVALTVGAFAARSAYKKFRPKSLMASLELSNLSTRRKLVKRPKVTELMPKGFKPNPLRTRTTTKSAKGLFGKLYNHHVATRINAAKDIGKVINGVNPHKGGEALGKLFVEKGIPKAAKVLSKVKRGLAITSLLYAGYKGVKKIAELDRKYSSQYLDSQGIKHNIKASLELSAPTGVKVYPTDPPNVAGRIGGRFAPSPNSKSRQKKVRGKVREHNRMANLIFRNEKGRVNTNPNFDSVVHNVKNNFHELLHESASEDNKGVLHAAKHLAIAGAVAGTAAEGYHQIHKETMKFGKKVIRAVKATATVKTPKEVLKAQKSAAIKEAKHAKVKLAARMGTKINRRVPTSQDVTNARKALKQAQETLLKAKGAAFTKAALARANPDYKAQAKYAIKAAKHVAKKFYRLSPAKMTAAGAVLGGAAVATTVAHRQIQAARKSLQKH